LSKTRCPSCPCPTTPLPKLPLPNDPLLKDPLPKTPSQPSEPLVKEPAPKKPLLPRDDEATIHVPFVPTPPSVVEAMLKLAKVGPDDVVADLGCGDGRIIVSAVKDFKAKRGLGIDLVPERIEDTIARAKNAEVLDKIVTKQADVLRLTPKDLEGVTVVTLYMLPEVNEKLAPPAQASLAPRCPHRLAPLRDQRLASRSDHPSTRRGRVVN
jgi:SAM-dependent methyltransferase